MNEIFEESEEHEKHGNEEYIHTKNADGIEHTKAPCSKNIYLLHQCLIKLKENDYISENFSDREIIEGLIDIINKNPEITPDELINKYEGDIMGDDEEEITSNNEATRKDDEYGPWSMWEKDRIR